MSETSPGTVSVVLYASIEGEPPMRFGEILVETVIVDGAPVVPPFSDVLQRASEALRAAEQEAGRGGRPIRIIPDHAFTSADGMYDDTGITDNGLCAECGGTEGFHTRADCSRDV